LSAPAGDRPRSQRYGTNSCRQLQSACSVVALTGRTTGTIDSALLTLVHSLTRVERGTLGRLARRMHRWLVSCLRMAKRKLSGETPLVPRSSAKGGRKLGGGTTHAIPHFSAWDDRDQCSDEHVQPVLLYRGLRKPGMILSYDKKASASGLEGNS